jgi:hypothetical protein
VPDACPCPPGPRHCGQSPATAGNPVDPTITPNHPASRTLDDPAHTRQPPVKKE